MIVAYADPPYEGCAHYYPEQQEVDHAGLIAELCYDYPDGWALSCHSNSLRTLLPLCPDDIRVAAWVKPWCSWKPGPWQPYAWEPILIRGGRPPTRLAGPMSKVRDWIASKPPLRQDFIGSKPAVFARWLFAFLGLRDGDTFVDLFPGTGAMSREWEAWCRQTALPLGAT